VTGTEPAMTAVLISRDGDVFCTTRLFETVVDPLRDTAASAFVF
jgi:hypothetical protein